MKLLATFLLVLYSINTFAYQTISQIVDLDLGFEKDTEILVFLANGRVVKIDKVDVRLREQLNLAKDRREWLKLNVNDDRVIESFSISNPPYPTLSSEKSFSFFPEDPYTPSILKSIDQARSIFYEANPNHNPDSQCYNRAHIWAYDWRVKNNIYSTKVWIFFTRKYIREYKFDWWFHVAPMVNVVVDNSVKQRVMDVKYAKGPLSINQWSDIFMRNSAKCPVVEKYSNHGDYPESAYCFLQISSMYYYQPVDLEMLEIKNSTKTKWIYPEVKHAFEEAFNIKI